MLSSVPRLSFVVKLSVRTFAHSGVLFYMANANQQDYAVLQVRGGRLQLSCDLGKGPAHASLATPINDGLWHTVSLIALTLSTKILAMHITNHKLSFDIFTVGNVQNIFMEHDLNILMISGVKEKLIILTHTMYCCLLLQIYLCYL